MNSIVTQDAQHLLAQLIGRLRQHIPNLVAVYGFGSFGTPAQRADSDIDLGLQPNAPLNPVDLFDLAGQLATLAHRDVDLVDLLACSTVMRAQIIATGRLLYCSDRGRCDAFAATAFSRYAHLNEARRGILRDRVKAGGILG